VYCHSCGVKRSDDAVYCLKCGRMLAVDENSLPDATYELATAVEAYDAPVRFGARRQVEDGELVVLRADKLRTRKGTLWAWLLPMVLALVVAGALSAYYFYQIGLNERVLELQAEAKAAALSGDYDKALDKLREASDSRPSYAALQTDMELVTLAKELERMLGDAAKQLETKDGVQAEKALDQVDNRLKNREEPVYNRVKEQLEQAQVGLEVFKLSEELEGIQTADELEAKLAVARSLDSDEAHVIKEQIIARLVQVCTEEAEELLARKSFSDALAVTARARSVAKDNEQLLELELRIRKEQEQYEKTEQQRLEHAMQKAAAEDLKNQTAAVEVVRLKTSLDVFGGLTVEAQFKNAATRPIYSVVIQYTVYDENDIAVGSGTASATPEYVEPGETMGFVDTVYDVQSEHTRIVVDHATWYLD
jgi:hypothetical protein